ncbi:MAG: septal ring lytic transglycosylase RlpA family protein [Gammaproteobacteria bacterium]|nr:septal ring lytic transglycosylase RlpA family protein [Gammaproteobacteria bacterium]
MILDPSDGAPPRQLDPDSISDAVPRAEPISRYGNPERYTVFGKDYRVMANSQGYSERGIASWYGTKFHGRRTSSGEPYDMYSMTAAHKTLPLPTYVRVRNLTNGRSAIVRVNDRGPFHGNRIIDLSYAAATKLGILGKGTGLVEVVAIDPRHPQAPPLVAKQSTGSGVTAAPSMFIQIGAFSSLHNANRLRQRLQLSLDQPIRISEGNLRGETLFRVQVGPLKDVEQSDQISRELAQLGHDQLHIVIE